MLRFCLVLGVAALSATAGGAHYNMLLPESAMVKKGNRVVFVYQWGHPFEHELFDAPAPEKVLVAMPDGKTQELTKTLEKFKKPGIGGKEVDAFRFTFTPQERGDYWLVLMAPPIWMEAEQEFYQDTVQVMLHVETQNGWDRVPPLPGVKMVPLTRPYGFRAGMVFQAEIDGLVNPMMIEPGFRSKVEIERYNPQRPKEIPPDELVTFKVQTDLKQVFTCTLPEPGWWCMTIAGKKIGTRVHGGQEFSIRQRVTLWVHVNDKVGGK